MKKLLLVLPFFVLFSCASAPVKENAADEAPAAAQTTAPAAPEAVTVETAEKEKNRAIEAMNKAKSVKADVAVKDEFGKALGIFNEAETLSASGAGNVAAAAGKYLESEVLFLEAYEKAKAKREEAVKQLDKAKADIKNVEEDAKAMEAEQGSPDVPAPAAVGGGV